MSPAVGAEDGYNDSVGDDIGIVVFAAIGLELCISAKVGRDVGNVLIVGDDVGVLVL